MAKDNFAGALSAVLVSRWACDLGRRSPRLSKKPHRSKPAGLSPEDIRGMCLEGDSYPVTWG